MNKENLLKLADYLDSLPEDYQHFDMVYFHTDATLYHYVEPGKVCGSSACAVGHAPSVEGLEVPEGTKTWYEYSLKVFDLRDEATVKNEVTEWDWCFADDWKGVDNTPRGAAARIRLLVAEGEVPHDADLQMNGEEDLKYGAYMKGA